VTQGAFPFAADPGPERLDLRGVTFWRPWAEAIVRPVPAGASAPHPKRVDNRPPRSALGSRVGRHIALHAGLKVHREGIAWLNDVFGYGWSESDLAPPGAILGVARVVGVAPSADIPWHFGASYGGKANVGWLLDDVVAFERPVWGPGGSPVVGALGCWRLPAGVDEAVREAVAAARGQ